MASAAATACKKIRIHREQMDKNRKKFDSYKEYVYLCIVGQITYLKRNGISYKKSVRCFLIGGISTVFVLYVVHLITTVASEIRGFVTNKLVVTTIDASHDIDTKK
jgi:hypothetical protein